MPSAADTLQARLEEAAGEAASSEVTIKAGRPSIADPVALLRHLEASGRFHRDSLIGRIFHPGRVSLRENEATDSLHVVVRDNHIAAHVDGVSPLGAGRNAQTGYSIRRAVAHNLAGAAHDLMLLVRGRQGDHRCELECEWELDADDRAAAVADDLLDPATTAWSVQVEVRVAGTLDEDRLRRAFASVFSGRMGRDDPLRCVECPDDDAVAATRQELQQSPAAMDDCPPLRAVLGKHPDGDYLMLNVNHAAADGVAAIDMLRDVARAYAGRRPARADRPTVTFLAAEDLPVHPAAPPVPAVVARARDGIERLRDWLARPARLAPEEASAAAGYGFHTLLLSTDDTRRVINRYRASTSRNVLVASLHLAIADWNRRHGSTPRGRVGVLVPVNLRPVEWPAETLANCTITARISTSRRHRTNRTAALGAVRAQHTRSKRTRTGMALLAALERSGLLPLWAKQSRVVLQPTTRNRYVDTAMLAYMGWLHEAPSFGEEAGDTVELWYSAPPRTPSCLSIGAAVVGGRLHVVFRYPHMLFGPDAIRRFADCYVAALRVVSEGRS